jgi:glycosyltransferase involved in cell wall biosynthesis
LIWQFLELFLMQLLRGGELLDRLFDRFLGAKIIKDAEVEIVLRSVIDLQELDDLLRSLLNVALRCRSVETKDADRLEKKFGSRIRVHRSPENIGAVRGYNAAAKEVMGDVLIFINNDTEVTKGWLEPLVAALDFRFFLTFPVQRRLFLQL